MPFMRLCAVLKLPRKNYAEEKPRDDEASSADTGDVLADGEFQLFFPNHALSLCHPPGQGPLTIQAFLN